MINKTIICTCTCNVCVHVSHFKVIFVSLKISSIKFFKIECVYIIEMMNQ